jgi:hypothetical protein
MVDNPRPAHERMSAFQTVYYRGHAEEKDEQGKVIRQADSGGPHELFPVDAKAAVARDPDNWSFTPFDGQDAAGAEDPGDESRQSAHGNTEEEVYANDAMHSMRKDGFAAEPAGSRAGVRPGAYSPSRPPRGAARVATIVDPAKDQTQGPGNDPKPGETAIAANRRRNQPTAVQELE